MKRKENCSHFCKKNKFFSLYRAESGITLIELLVGISIGLLTVIVALASLTTLRGITGTISEASALQQQAAYAFRVIGQQVRQAGSVQLNLAIGKSDPFSTPDYLDKVAFVPNENRKNTTIKGNDTPGKNEFSLEIAYQNYEESLVNDKKYIFYNCLGQQANSTDILIESKFAFDNIDGELECKSRSSKQPIVENVTDLQIFYLVQDKISTPGYPTIQKLKAADIASDAWDTVFGVIVCLELSGNEKIDTTGTKYSNCKGESKDRGNKLRMVFQNTFQIRSQGSPI